ncbi:MAG: hypothetical protein A2V67_09985 [Deltaproteobacteria bacterium RBG_13_61_14]|nr:MAG: hypothetical protein A2V67_09985 [Deltaproteobacteria bacterium RBG_13_61_14]
MRKDLNLRSKTMKRWTLILGFLLVTCPRPPAWAEFTPQEWEVLKTGEVLATEVFTPKPDGTQATDVLVKIWIKGPPEDVWKVIRDYDHFGEFMPRVRSCRITKQDGEAYWIVYDMEVLGIQVIYNLITMGKEKYRRIEFDLDRLKPNDIREARGYYVLDDAPDGQGTVLSYSALVATGIPVPQVIARRISKPNLIQVLKNVRQRVESGGAWKKPAGS